MNNELSKRYCAFCKHWQGDRNSPTDIGKCTNTEAYYKKVWEQLNEVKTENQKIYQTSEHPRAFSCSKGYEKGNDYKFENGIFYGIEKAELHKGVYREEDSRPEALYF